MFGSQTNTTFGISAPSFGATNTGFGNVATTSSTTATTTSTSSFFSQPTTFGAQTSSSTGFSFGGFGTNTFGNTGFNTNTQQQQTQPGSTGFGLFNAANNSFNNNKRTFGPPMFPQQQQQPQQPTLTLTLNNTTTSPTTATTTSTTTSVGLGGTSLHPANNGKSTTGGDQTKNKSYRDQLVPPEIIPLVENMKKFLEKQKQIRDENEHEHYYIDSILNIGTSIEEAKVQMNKIDIQLQKNEKSIEFLKKDTNNLLSNGELVYRISRIDLPISNSAEVIEQNNFINAKTHQYFMQMVDNFKKQMIQYSEQIHLLKSHCTTTNNDQHQQQQYQQNQMDEINQIIRKQHENFVSLASKIYLIHEYANKLRVDAAFNNNDYNTNNDTTTTNELTNRKQIRMHTPNDSYGPTPFLNTSSYKKF